MGTVRVDPAALEGFLKGIQGLADGRLASLDQCWEEQCAHLRVVLDTDAKWPQSVLCVDPKPIACTFQSVAPRVEQPAEARQGQCAASPAPKSAKTPSKTPSKRILQGMEVFERTMSQYENQVYRGNTPLKESSRTPGKLAPAPGGQTQSRMDDFNSIQPTGEDLIYEDQGSSQSADELKASVPSAAEGGAAGRAGAAPPAGEAVERVDPSLDAPRLPDAAEPLDAPAAPAAQPKADSADSANRGVPVLEEPEEFPELAPPLPPETWSHEVAPDFPVHAVHPKGLRPAGKGSSQALQPTKLRLQPPVQSKVGKRVASPAPEPKRACTQSTQSIRGLQHQGKASPLREKKDKENRPGRVPSAVPRDTPRKGPPMSEFSPRKAPPVAKREPSPFVLEPIGALLMEENYDITDKENSDDDEDLDRSKKFVPNWVRGWPSRVKAQGDLDPDAIFGPIPQCSLERIFRDPASVAARANRAWRPRGSSNDWQKDKLRQAEIEEYRQRMGQTRKVA